MVLEQRLPLNRFQDDDASSCLGSYRVVEYMGRAGFPTCREVFMKIISWLAFVYTSMFVYIDIDIAIGVHMRR